jgi:hypothetical protein
MYIHTYIHTYIHHAGLNKGGQCGAGKIDNVTDPRPVIFPERDVEGYIHTYIHKFKFIRILNFAYVYKHITCMYVLYVCRGCYRYD